MTETGQLTEYEGRYEFRIPEMSLIVRGNHPEWVLLAASEVLSNAAKLETESKIEELEALVEFDEASDIEVESAKYESRERFEVIPQCLVTLGRIDYKWAATAGRNQLDNEFDGKLYRRVHDMSLTFGDSFLKNEEGVEMSNETTQ